MGEIARDGSMFGGSLARNMAGLVDGILATGVGGTITQAMAEQAQQVKDELPDED
ncbi:hypothetical protein ACLGIH_24275 [Streptomyces sp. HMX87]|uniref:hypothetical protein n=1 Tax=Streptomyces sp. HMX87 TaxID=3390849 RepID=UPI003A889C3E